MDSIRLSCIQDGARWGISRGNGSGNMMLGREHPQVELRFSLNMGGVRFSGTLNPNAKGGT